MHLQYRLLHPVPMDNRVNPSAATHQPLGLAVLNAQCNAHYGVERKWLHSICHVIVITGNPPLHITPPQPLVPLWLLAPQQAHHRRHCSGQAVRAHCLDDMHIGSGGVKLQQCGADAVRERHDLEQDHSQHHVEQLQEVGVQEASLPVHSGGTVVVVSI